MKRFYIVSIISILILGTLGSCEFTGTEEIPEYIKYEFRGTIKYDTEHNISGIKVTITIPGNASDYEISTDSDDKGEYGITSPYIEFSGKDILVTAGGEGKLVKIDPDPEDEAAPSTTAKFEETSKSLTVTAGDFKGGDKYWDAGKAVTRLDIALTRTPDPAEPGD